MWAVTVVSLLLVTLLLPGFSIDTSQPHWWRVVITLPIELALMVVLLRPLLVLATLPLNAVTLGLPTLFYNGILLYLVALIEPAFHIDNLLYAFVGLALLTVINTQVSGWLRIDDLYPFFQTIMRVLGRRFGMRPDPEVERGLLIIQIDGLSWRSLSRARRRGRMPTVSALLGLGTHWLYRWHAGVPSNTPVVQSGLFYGTRENAPGYRWYDRREKVVRSAANPADLRVCEANAAARGGEPLLEGGSCINSLLGGGAAKRLMTLSAVGEPGADRRGGARADFSLFWLSPYTYTTAVLSTAWDFVSALIWQTLTRFSRRGRHIPRGVRHAATRAVATALLRETAMFWVEQDVTRGVPLIYTNFVGYDEVAHSAGPDSGEALGVLLAFDRKLQRLRRLARRAAPIEYDVVLLSDHGQSSSLPFHGLYGTTLEDLVGELALRRVPERRRPMSELAYVAALLEDLKEAHPFGKGRWLAVRGQLTLERLRTPSEEPASGDPGPEIEVCVSGCLAHLYCKEAARRLRLEEIRSLFPGLVEGLASHRGIGFVVALDEQGDPICIGGAGLRNLETGEVRGDDDPLAPYGDPLMWSRELARLARGEDSGDLIVNGSMLSRRRVVSFESQIGTHGGMGGPQNEAFAILPTSWRTDRRDLRSPEALYAHLLSRGRRPANPR